MVFIDMYKLVPVVAVKAVSIFFVSFFEGAGFIDVCIMLGYKV